MADLPARTPQTDDVELRLRVSRANLPNLEAGVVLGHDEHGRAIEFRLAPQPDGSHAVEVQASFLGYATTPNPVDAVRVDD